MRTATITFPNHSELLPGLLRMKTVEKSLQRERLSSFLYRVSNGEKRKFTVSPIESNQSFNQRDWQPNQNASRYQYWYNQAYPERRKFQRIW